MSRWQPAAYKEYQWIVADPQEQIEVGVAVKETLLPGFRRKPKVVPWPPIVS
jgi:hypothetical protein